MEIITLIIIAIGLSVDSFAASIPCGLVSKKINFVNASKVAIVLALTQGVMPILGWLIGSGIKNYVANIDHWIAFSLFLFLGFKIIKESNTRKKESKNNYLSFFFIICISLATSIDAFIVGISFALIQTKIIIAAIIIAMATYIFSMLGILIGKKTGSKLENRLGIIGGILLIVIGIKILVEHLYF